MSIGPEVSLDIMNLEAVLKLIAREKRQGEVTDKLPLDKKNLPFQQDIETSEEEESNPTRK